MPKFIAYHGSPKGDLKRLMPGSGGEYQRVAGIYVTKSYDEALKYTKMKGQAQPENVYRVEVTLRNPANRDVLDELGYRLNGIEMQKELKRMGHDGVVDDYMDEVIAFSHNQVRITGRGRKAKTMRRRRKRFTTRRRLAQDPLHGVRSLATEVGMLGTAAEAVEFIKGKLKPLLAKRSISATFEPGPVNKVVRVRFANVAPSEGDEAYFKAPVYLVIAIGEFNDDGTLVYPEVNAIEETVRPNAAACGWMDMTGPLDDVTLKIVKVIRKLDKDINAGEVPIQKPNIKASSASLDRLIVKARRGGKVARKRAVRALLREAKALTKRGD